MKNKITIDSESPAEDGYLDVANFVKVTKWDENLYPKGIRYFSPYDDFKATEDPKGTEVHK